MNLHSRHVKGSLGMRCRVHQRIQLRCRVHQRIQQKLLSEGEGLIFENATNMALSMEPAIAQASEIQNFQQNKLIMRKESPEEHCSIITVFLSVCVLFYLFCILHQAAEKDNAAKTDPESVESKQPSAEPHPLYTMYKVGLHREKPILIDIEINNNLIQMELDTGASVSVMSKNVLEVTL